MLCCTSVLSSVLRSMAQALGELLYAVLQICALVPSWALGELLYAVLHICALFFSWALGELLYAVLHICAVSVL